MWQIRSPAPARLIVGILAANKDALEAATAALAEAFGPIDVISQVWPFAHTDYYQDQLGPNPIRQFVSHANLVRPDELASIKHRTNEIERSLARRLGLPWPRPVNLDPGLIERSRLTLASTKDYCHRIYLADGIYAEVTLVYRKGQWQDMPYTYPDYRQGHYHSFFSIVRQRLIEQLRRQQC
ncbi:MAG: DUF4416 family protein [Sedimentisphaerales bacterium]|jgi:hypothetical protein|nr:DUF4416 family protein [Sedimentisphaerales bacterium]